MEKFIHNTYIIIIVGVFAKHSTETSKHHCALNFIELKKEILFVPWHAIVLESDKINSV